MRTLVWDTRRIGVVLGGLAASDQDAVTRAQKLLDAQLTTAMQSAYSTRESGLIRQKKANVSDTKPPSRTADPASASPTDGLTQGLGDGQVDSVLKLEESSDGSTQAVGAGGPGDSSGRSSGDSKIKPLTTSDSAVGESSTGGFETLLGTLVVEQGLVTPDEMEL